MTETTSRGDPDLVRLYLNEIGAIPLLTAEQEVDLARRIEAGVYAEALLTTSPRRGRRGRQRRDLEAVARDGRRAKADMIRANLRLVVAVVRQHNRGRLAMPDAIQEGNLGLIRAVEKFDYTKGYKFSTYATWWIRQALDRGAAHARTVRLPVHVEEEVSTVRAAEHELAGRLGRDPTAEEIADATGRSARRVGELERLSQQTVSLDVPAGADAEGMPFGELIEDAELTPTPDVAEHEALAVAVREAVAHLPPREARAITLRYGLRTGQAETLREIADELHVSRERARQLLLRALRRMRDADWEPPLAGWAEPHGHDGAA